MLRKRKEEIKEDEGGKWASDRGRRRGRVRREARRWELTGQGNRVA